MRLGAFSISLNVVDIKKSKQFYEKLGFEVFGGDMEQNYLIMKNGDTLIGLFQGMFKQNILTFNPGWNAEGEALEKYEDVRQIQEQLKNDGISLIQEVKTATAGPGSIMLKDPDGNLILVDQHI